MLTFQQIIHKLSEFWEKQGCIIHQGHDLEMGAGTFNPATFLRCLGPEPYKTAYVEPSRRPSDGRYGENPNRLQLFHQFQVIFKPSPLNIMDMYKKSLEAIGIDLSKHDLRFVHDDWESPTIGAYGLGWEVWLDGMEVTQFTYFQGVANLPLDTVSVELTYGLERLSMYVQNVDNVFDLKWNDEYTYGDIVLQNEIEWSAYNFTYASTEMWLRHFDDFEKEAKDLIARQLPIPAYDFVMKASHAFNMLEARGVISVTERTGYITRVRDLARLIANEYLAMRQRLGFPLMEKLRKEDYQVPSVPEAKKSFDPKKQGTFLLEIGSEELPATFVPIGMKNLEKGLSQLLKEKGLPFRSIDIHGTPRRLAAVVHDLAEGTQEQTIERKGPKVASAFDEQGKPTPQGKGFLTAIGCENVTLKDIEAGRVDTLKIQDDYLFAMIHKKGESVYEVLATHLPSLILGIDFPKKMHWGTLPTEYARPLHWIVALFDDQVIPFVVGNIATHNHTFGHAQLDKQKIVLRNAKDYLSQLKKHHVMADVEERKNHILTQLHKIENELAATACETSKVLSQVLFLTEWPELTYSEFSKDYLKVPEKVLISEMVEHQRYFPLANKDGTLTNTFVITADNTPNDLIRHGNQKVLSARLADGAFLYQQDLKVPLQDFHQMLAKMTFQKQLGSMMDKVMRIVTVSQKLNDSLKLADSVKLDRAAFLCKADLASGMVKEFPELQGTIGKTYALVQKEDPEVAQAIEEHWWPRTEGSELPQCPTGIILSLSDKFDNLASYFKIGLKPTSSSDPYSLRRQTIGVLKILIDNKLTLDLSEFLNAEVLQFVTARAKTVLEDYGFAKDEVDASLMGLCNDPYDQYCKLQALQEFRKETTFDNLLEVYKRAKGQLEKGKAGRFDPTLAVEPEEKALLTALEQLEKHWDAWLKNKHYKEAFKAMATLQSPLSHFFDNVKVLADDPKLQTNRLSLLHRIFTLFGQLLDFSKIQRS